MKKIFEVLGGTLLFIAVVPIAVTWIFGGPFIFFAAWAKSGDILKMLIEYDPWFGTRAGRDAFKTGYFVVMTGGIMLWAATIALLKNRN